MGRKSSHLRLKKNVACGDFRHRCPICPFTAVKFHNFIDINLPWSNKALCHPFLISWPSHFVWILQVYGTVFHMNQGNPFKLKALVDRWPDFNTVVIRPQEQVRCQMWNEYACMFVFAMCLPCTWQCGRPWDYRNESRCWLTSPCPQKAHSLEEIMDKSTGKLQRRVKQPGSKHR